MTNVSTRDLTTLDFIKLLAVALMVVDHIGFYFFPENLVTPYGDPDLWWRVVGRTCVPIWFFLIGYARTRDLSPPIWIGLMTLVLASMVTGMYVFPLNVLATIIFVRLTIDRLAVFAFGRGENLFMLLLLIGVLYAPANVLAEYSTLGLLIAMLGYATRKIEDGAAFGLLLKPNFLKTLFWITVAFNAYGQWILFPFNITQGVVSCVLTTIGLYMVMYVPKVILPTLTAQLSPTAIGFIKFCGRRTLEIYVGHLVIFKFAALVFGFGYIGLYGWFDWDLSAGQALSILMKDAQ
jgi:hypothetical protein